MALVSDRTKDMSGSNLTPAQVDTIKFAAAVLEAEVAGRRTSQAARDLRAMLPTERLDLTGLHDHVHVDDEEICA